jgi:ornithine carbamoyltransferase
MKRGRRSANAILLIASLEQFVRNRDLLSVSDLTAAELARVLDVAMALKDAGRRPLLSGRTLALVFEKPSLRTRVSFDVAMTHLGGHCVYLSPPEVGLGERETPADVARVLSRYVDAIAARTFTQATVRELAEHADVPVINALSDEEHPCQALADLLTIREKKGVLRDITVGYVGDGNNVAASLALAGGLAGMHIRIASPLGYEVPAEIRVRAESAAAASGGSIEQLQEPAGAVDGADVVYTDVWASMGQETEASARREAFAGYTVDAKLMSRAKREAIFLHDLPAHRGEEVTADVIDGPQSAVFDQAENRMHAQKAVLALLLSAEELP